MESQDLSKTAPAEDGEAKGKGVFDWSVVGFLALLIGIAVVVGLLLS